MSRAPALSVRGRAWRHMRSLWPRWTLVPIAPFAVFVAFLVARGDLRWDHVAVVAFVALLAYTNATTKKLCVAAYPMFLTGIVYNAMGYVKNVGVSPERVHDCDLRSAELALFGLTSNGQRITPSDFFHAHHATWLDLYCAVPYGTFILASACAAIYLYFKDYRAAERFAWAFFLVNVAGFVTYHVFPAAPPWYFHAHGCEVSMTAMPSAGPRLEHVDQILGIGFFKGMYGRSSDLYGAVPSLHVAYPLLILVEGWRAFGRGARALSILFYLSMAFAAVYLDHHWVIDVLLGSLYCLAIIAVVRRIQTPPKPDEDQAEAVLS